MLACPGRFGSDVYPRFTQPPPTPPPRSSCHVTYHMIPIAQLNTTPYNNIWHPATKYNIESDLHPRFTQTLPLSLCHVPYQPNQQTISCIKVCNAYHNRTYHTMLCNTIQYPIWFTQPPPLSSCQPTKHTEPTKPKLLVKAVNTWVRSAFGNIFTLLLENVALVGYNSFLILVLKIGRTSKKNTL